MEKKTYIIVGNNNFWYGTTGLITEEELESELVAIKQRIANNEYEGEDSTPNELFAYEVVNRKTFTL